MMMNILKCFLACFLTSIFIPLSGQTPDDFVKRSIMQERRVLAHPDIREADLLWEKRVWRIIDTREKMNLAFRYPQAPFFDLLVAAARQGALDLYSSEGGQNAHRLTDEEMQGILSARDTVAIYNDAGEVVYIPTSQDIYFEDIKRFRVKEAWFFDEQTATLRVRILGIAPLREVYGENGNFRYEQALFWVSYQQLRPLLARHSVFIDGNDQSLYSWEDLFEQRRFSSTITKQSNVLDHRLQDYLTGVDQLWEAEKIQKEIFQFEHDLWSY